MVTAHDTATVHDTGTATVHETGGELPRLDALGAKGTYRSRTAQPVTDVTGTPVAELGTVPALFVDRTMPALRRATPLAYEERVRAVARAGELFAHAELGGQSVTEYESAVSRVGGIPISVVRAATRTAADRTARLADEVAAARPAGAVADWRDDRTRAGHAVWTRRGEVFAVHAAGNHPGTHTLWPQALVLGYRVAVRPSRREPFTPHRLVTALRAAGFGDDQVVVLPTEHEAGEAMLRGADLAYGGDEVIRGHADEPKVLSLRPGRSKILLDRDCDWRAHLDSLVDSVAHHGGTGCVNATGVLVEGDPAPVAEALAERLAALPALPPEDDAAVLPVQRLSAARALRRYVDARAEGTRVLLGGDRMVRDLGDGSAAVGPTVHQLDSPHAEQLGAELPFPCVWVAPWDRARDGLAPLKDTLVMGLFSEDEGLVDAIVAEPTVSNVHLGGVPTHWTDTGMPHDDFLSGFLMRSKTVVRG
ncbi:aldehyde dehydrogenase family protein [Streptomyces sp. NPDC058676]|uniref:aldehyde dehydrogenase family protein n=1 Tax=unclassified Streptomyces TaxID=2593676 RepID=UPI003661B36E